MAQIRTLRCLLLWSAAAFVVPIAHAQLSPSYSNASLNGTYVATCYTFNSSATQGLTPATGNPLPAPLGFKTLMGTVTFDGAGNATASFTKNQDGTISTTSEITTYSVASDGTLALADGVSGIVVGNGEIALGSVVTSGEDPEIIVLVRQEDASDNTTTGANALSPAITGVEDTADGAFALAANTSANDNTATGYQALQSNTTGSSNTGAGAQALLSNSTGSNNTAFGYQALYSNTSGKGNEAQGVDALYSDTTGERNLGIGSNALYDNVTGSYNLALGFDAGYNATGNDNIYLNNKGVSGESQTLRLGTQGTTGNVGSGITTAYIAGVASTVVTGSAVYVTASGQLGVLASSERFKTDVRSMGSASEKLAQLRPVTFRLKSDPTGTTQYGLVAEQVAKVYPELVVRDGNGRINGVRYEELSPMLLNVVQQQQSRLAAQSREISEMHRELGRLRKLEQQVAELQRLYGPAKARH